MVSRRRFLQLAGIGAVGVATGGVLRLGARGPRPELAPVLEILERSSRDDVLERLADWLAVRGDPAVLRDALVVAASRHVVPRTTFSKAHHALICVHAAHRAGEHAPPTMRWHPLLWSADTMKGAQLESSGTDSSALEPLALAQLPPAATADAELEAALEEHDGARAELAIAALHRAGRRDRVVDLVTRYGSRDLRHIGHKAIHASCTLETLRVAGWDHAEDVLRSTAHTLALHYREEGRDLDGAWHHSHRRLAQLGPDWHRGRDHSHVAPVLAVLRAASPGDAVSDVAERLARGASLRSIWDAMLLSGAELMFNHPTSVEALHAVTASHAARCAFDATAADATRRLLLLQNAARVADFHAYAAHWAARRNKPAMFALAIEQLAPLDGRGLDAIFDDIGRGPAERMRAAQAAMAFAGRPDGVPQLARRAVEMGVSRAVDTHDLKLPAAAIEDARHISPRWRPHYLAACTARFRGASDPRAPIADRIAAVTRALA
jgi:hypothetical protein